MGKKKKKEDSLQALIRACTQTRRLNVRDRRLFDRAPRGYHCLAGKGRFQDLIALNKLCREKIQYLLGVSCKTMEHQIITLRGLTRLKKKNVFNRRLITQYILDCLYKHHNVIYEAVLFGSTVNGLGFCDSDLDLRLRPLVRIGQQVLEPIHYDKDLAERTLRDIAFQTTRCAPAVGNFVPSSRCPIAKLTFLQGDPKAPKDLQEGISYDISLSSANSLGTFNSIFMRFLCKLSPKFHLMATALRYWSKIHKLIVSGYLSSYALVNMLIFFCQTLNPPLLPTVDEMRDIQVAKERQSGSGKILSRALTQIEWQCTICLDKSSYPESPNTEPVSVLLMKFFEFYLNFTYSNKIITTRSGRSLSIGEFKSSNHYHPRYPIKEYINIQDPFDLKHNLTSGMTGEHFNLLIITFRHSYERLARELLNNFFRPNEVLESYSRDEPNRSEVSDVKLAYDHKLDWGLNAIFIPIDQNEIRQSW